MTQQTLMLQESVRIAQLLANINPTLLSKTHSLSNTNHSKRTNTEAKISTTMLQITVIKKAKRMKAITMITSTDSQNSLQPLDRIAVTDALAASEVAVSEAEPISAAEEHQSPAISAEGEVTMQEIANPVIEELPADVLSS